MNWLYCWSIGAYCPDSKPLFWHRAYFVGSVGGATLEIVRAYVDAQGTAEHARKSAAKATSKTKSSA
ncbi:transposase [Ferrovum myxofaciens]|uniref:transposase n=1 Tax=Ferrovum myxofaciens TaxID=416213 RepID=UPI003B5A4061